jgi:hypothetical protein
MFVLVAEPFRLAVRRCVLTSARLHLTFCFCVLAGARNDPAVCRPGSRLAGVFFTLIGIGRGEDLVRCRVSAVDRAPAPLPAWGCGATGRFSRWQVGGVACDRLLPRWHGWCCGRRWDRPRVRDLGARISLGLVAGGIALRSARSGKGPAGSAWAPGVAMIMLGAPGVREGAVFWLR